MCSSVVARQSPCPPLPLPSLSLYVGGWVSLALAANTYTRVVDRQTDARDSVSLAFFFFRSLRFGYYPPSPPTTDHRTPSRLPSSVIHAILSLSPPSLRPALPRYQVVLGMGGGEGGRVSSACGGRERHGEIGTRRAPLPFFCDFLSCFLLVLLVWCRRSRGRGQGRRDSPVCAPQR